MTEQDKSAHTPGPWLAEVSEVDGRGWSENKQNVKIVSGDVLIAIYDTDFVEYPDDAENEANARLIASAPDLLEALLLHDVYMDTPQDRGGAFGPKGRARAAFDDAKRAAIAKATGDGQ